MDCIITIDIGTSAVRIFAFEMNGTAIGFSKGSYPTFHTEPIYSEQDPEQVFITVLYVLKNFLTEKINAKKYRVTAICFSAAMHSVLPVDKNGVPLGNAITWADNRGKKEADDLKKLPMAKTIYDATGTPIHPMSPLIKIAWIKRHDKERFSKTDKFIAIKNYIIQQLTGECVIDYSLASATGLFNIHKLHWDNNALAYAGINAERLPTPVPVFYSSLKLRREYQVSLGLPAKTKIIIGASDGCMATLGAGVWGEGKATITIEQSGAVRVAGNKMIRDSKQRFFNYLLTDGYYVSGGPTNNGGVIFEWFAKQFGNIGALVLIVGSVVFFILLLVTGNSMAVSVRERTPEVAVLKAVGYSDTLVLWFVMAESLIIAVAGGMAGLLAAVGLIKIVAIMGNLGGMLPSISVSGSQLALGVCAAVAVGLASGLLPALGAMRLRVVDGLRRV